MGMPSVDEIDLSDIADIIPNGHLILTRIEKNLQIHVINLFNFYAKIDDGKCQFKCENQEKSGIPYQYNPKHQVEWANNVLPLARNLSAVDPLVMDKYQKLFTLEIAKSMQPQTQTTMPQTSPAGLASTIVQVDQNPKQQREQRKSFWSFLGRKPELPQITPFKMSINEIVEKRKIIASFYGYIKFHNFKLDWCMPFDIAGDTEAFKFADYTGMMNFLSIEATEFKNRIGDVLQIISEGFDITRGIEKKYAVDTLSSASQMTERHRQNF